MGFLPLFLTGTHGLLPSNAEITGSLQRENSYRTVVLKPTVFFVEGKPKPPILPVVETRPRPVRLAYASKRPVDARYPRIVKVIGKGGQCVTVPQKAGFPIHAGAARNWPSAAKRLGYSVNRVPAAGAVFVTSESSYGTGSGHVGLILKVEGDWLYVRESNYVRLTVTEGWIPKSAPVAVIHKS